ncbi:DUF2306 domain-containing protein [Granulosicoccus sp. 3-233]|uniref:DUF2306 domain-containing protein n=1 Tax=Granulosicoccus sp. 3-233 TaxID=3417969 RepID=UPI003D32905D
MWITTRYCLYAASSLLVALVSWRFLLIGMDAAFAGLPHQIVLNPSLFLIHVLAGPAALLLAPLQFSRGIRLKMPGIHRWTGRAYALMVLFAGLSGLFIGLDAEGGPAARAGFVLLSLLWLWTTAKGVMCARARQFNRHRDWMMRSAALSFAGVTLRIWLPLQLVAGIPFEIAYPVVAWACWVPNLLFAELMLKRTALPTS